VLWRYIRRYRPDASPETHPVLDALVEKAINYYRDFVTPTKAHRPADATERAALAELADVLAALPRDANAETIQNEIYEVGKRHAFADLKSWFQALYQILLGQDQG